MLALCWSRRLILIPILCIFFCCHKSIYCAVFFWNLSSLSFAEKIVSLLFFYSFFQLQTVSLLFVDNPVGTGYSYVEDNSAYATTNDEIARDMVKLLKAFVSAQPDFKVNISELVTCRLLIH